MALALLLAAPLIGLSPSLRAGEPDDQALRAIVARTLEAHARPASRSFDEQAKRLRAATQQACRQGGPERAALPDPLRAGFRDTAHAWGRVSVARFGPLAADSRFEKLAFWPDGRGVIALQTRQLAAALPEADADAIVWLARQSAAVQGLPAFDLIAFGEPATPPCRMAVAIAGNIARLSDEVSAGFARDRELALLTPGPDNPAYRTPREAVAELLRALSTQAQVLTTVMILPPLGARPEDARASRVFLRFAPATRPFLVGAIDGLSQMLDAMSLDAVVTAEARGALDSARRELRTAREMIDALPEDPQTMLTDAPSRGRLATAVLALEGFDRLVTGRISASLGLQTGFNALDGD
jgi:predicted lipoprotein